MGRRSKWPVIAIALFLGAASLSFVVTRVLRGGRGAAGSEVAVVVDLHSDVELDRIITERWRAMSIPVDQASSKDGLLQPNDHVDILGTFMKPEKKEWVTITLLQNVTVLAVGASLFSTDREVSETVSSRGDQTVTVLVTPEEAELLTFAVDKGKISLSPRNENNTSTELARPLRSLWDVLGWKKRDHFIRNDALIIDLPEPSLIPFFD